MDISEVSLLICMTLLVGATLNTRLSNRLDYAYALLEQKVTKVGAMFVVFAICIFMFVFVGLVLSFAADVVMIAI